MDRLITIEDLTKDNIEDIFTICSRENRFNAEQNDKGIEVRRKWLKYMLQNHGPCAKIAYLYGDPVAQVMYYSEESVPFIDTPRRDVLHIHCIYNPFPEAQRKGVAEALIKSVIKECNTGFQCLGCNTCSFITALPFPHEGDFSLTDFYSKYGFRQGHREMFLEAKGTYRSRNMPDIHPIQEDFDSAIIFYTPACEWGYFYAHKVAELIQNLDPNLSLQIINAWEQPEAFKRRFIREIIAGRSVVKGRVLSRGNFWSDRKAFVKKLREILEK